MRSHPPHIRTLVLALAVVAIPFVCGCPLLSLTFGNRAPSANAGPDQTAQIRSTVTLNAGLSGDPDGDPLTYTWAQTGGPAVTISSAAAVNPTFTAPATPAVLTFRLTVNDGSGATDTDTVDITVVPIPTLFVASFNNNRVLAFENPATLDGNVAPSRALDGLQTQLNQPAAAAVDLNFNLVVASYGNSRLPGYGTASVATGNVPPVRTVQGALTRLAAPADIVLDSANDQFFVAASTADAILVFDNVSTAAFNGNIAPARVIETPTAGSLQEPLGLHYVAASDTLYVANNGAGNVLVFSNASTLGGDVTPDRTIDALSFTDIYDVHVDSSGRLYVVDSIGSVYVYDNAAALSGFSPPDRLVDVPGATFVSAIEIDAAGTAYLAGNGSHAIYVYDNIASLNGAVAPDRTIQGVATELSGPIGLFLVEP